MSETTDQSYLWQKPIGELTKAEIVALQAEIAAHPSPKRIWSQILEAEALLREHEPVVWHA